MEENATYQEKRPVRWFVGMVFPMFFHGIRRKRLRSHDEVLGFGAHNDKRGLFSLHEHGFFSLGRGWVMSWVCCIVPVSPGRA